jgi:hypothetical protein
MKLQLSQLFLILALAGFALYVFRLRNALADRIIYLILACVGCVLVLNPDLSTRLSHFIGIGRGADLLLYIIIIFSLFRFVHLAAQLKKVERQITALTRKIALADATEGSSARPGDGGATADAELPPAHDSTSQFSP